MPNPEMHGVCDRLSPAGEPEPGMNDLAMDVLRRCAAGELSSAVALVRLLIACRDLDGLRLALAKLERTDGAADLQRAIERIRALVAQKSEGSALVLHMLEQEHALAEPDGQTDQVGHCRRLFDRLVERNAEASVALYSLGEPGLLDGATREVVGLLEQLGVLRPERDVLDIGCGIGRFARALADRVATITGTDISPRMLAAARQRCAGLANVSFIETSGRDLAPLAAGSFDAVLAIDVMPYLYRAGKALVATQFKEVARVLRAGGDFVILNLSYGGDLEFDRQDACRLAGAAGLCILRNGTSDLRLWDGTTFHLRKLETGAADQPTRFSMRP
jgi:SAM-dependent methyltransferase